MKTDDELINAYLTGRQYTLTDDERTRLHSLPSFLSGSKTSREEKDKTCIDAADWLDMEDEPDDPLVKGLIERGEMVAIVGQSKAGKSFLAMQLAVCIALGAPFLGRNTTQESVYVANLEVSAKQYKKRFRRICRALNASPHDFKDRLFFDNMKGESASWRGCLKKCKERGCKVAIIDPFYQIFKGDEVNAEDCKGAIEAQKLFQRENITLGVVYHSPKGFSGDRQLIDMISGSAVLARFPESIIGLLNHGKDEKCRVLKCILRNYAPPDDVTIRYEGGQFVVCDDIDAVVESQDRRASKRVKSDAEKREEFAANVRKWGAEIAARLVGVNESDIKGEMQRVGGLSAAMAGKVFDAIAETAGAYGMRFDKDYGTFNWK